MPTKGRQWEKAIKCKGVFLVSGTTKKEDVTQRKKAERRNYALAPCEGMDVYK